MVFFQNLIQLYQIKHIMGEAVGFNVLCSRQGENPLFVGLGLNSRGVNHATIAETLHRELNKNPVGMEIVTDEIARKTLASYKQETLELSAKLREYRVAREDFNRQGGGNILQITQLDIERISQFAQTPLEQCDKLIAS